MLRTITSSFRGGRPIRESYADESLLVTLSVILFFFFQAEDGIRDLTVTGVQTCALPIFFAAASGENENAGTRVGTSPVSFETRIASASPSSPSGSSTSAGAIRATSSRRSEERRVGEECRSRWSPDHLKKKKTSVYVRGCI